MMHLVAPPYELHPDDIEVLFYYDRELSWVARLDGDRVLLGTAYGDHDEGGVPTTYRTLLCELPIPLFGQLIGGDLTFQQVVERATRRAVCDHDGAPLVWLEAADLTWLPTLNFPDLLALVHVEPDQLLSWALDGSPFEAHKV